ncbi:MAG: NAD(P)/FAD-dependent oxidoreductase [Cytophagales bacterium]|nr:NAD(P)/FAD-dependent oxidoreductase [Cytophagales bacterium]
MTYDSVIVGGGASGYFAAAQILEQQPDAKVAILEKQQKVLAKVKVSGGGRCNVTNACREISQLIKNYPRGEKPLRKVFSQFSTGDTVRWFEDRGVRIKSEPDQRMFPASNSSQTIIDCLRRESEGKGAQLFTGTQLLNFEQSEGVYKLSTTNGDFSAKTVLLAAGGGSKIAAYDWLQKKGIAVESPVPSLFTFNTPGSFLNRLMGLSMPDALVKIAGTKFEFSGPLLLTHWGLSGPAVLKLSAYAARHLSELNYQHKVLVRWWSDKGEEEIRQAIAGRIVSNPKKVVASHPLWNMPKRLWEALVAEANIEENRIWVELGKKHKNKLVDLLSRTELEVKGKTTFKEEFVTCGGVKLSEIDIKTMESNQFPNLFFSGELLNVDGITGGFNFQFAWSSGYLAGKAMAEKLAEKDRFY